MRRTFFEWKRGKYVQNKNRYTTKLHFLDHAWNFNFLCYLCGNSSNVGHTAASGYGCNFHSFHAGW